MRNRANSLRVPNYNLLPKKLKGYEDKDASIGDVPFLCPVSRCPPNFISVPPWAPIFFFSALLRCFWTFLSRCLIFIPFSSTNFNVYYEFFRWFSSRNYFRFVETVLELFCCFFSRTFCVCSSKIRRIDQGVNCIKGKKVFPARRRKRNEMRLKEIATLFVRDIKLEEFVVARCF